MKEKGKKQRQKQRSGASYSEIVRALFLVVRFCFMFKLGFVQLICTASLIFK